MPKELCGAKTPNGPCTLPKGHRTGYHRHRIYPQVTWTIETDKGVHIESGAARVPLNYAISEALAKHPLVVIHLKKWDEVGTINDGDTESSEPPNERSDLK